MIAARDSFGPWAQGLDHAERLARVRSLRATVRPLTDPLGVQLAGLLHQAG